MANNISKIKLKGTVYDIKDTVSGYITDAYHDSTKLDTSLKGANNGLAELDANGKVPSAQLPSYVDDVVEYDSRSAFPATGESGKIYIALDTNKTYRWSGTEYVEISASLALGETSSTAYRGDRGKAAYDHSQVTSGNPHKVSLSDLGVTATSSELNYVDGVTSNIQTQLDGKQATLVFNTSYSASTNKAATMADIQNAIGDAMADIY